MQPVTRAILRSYGRPGPFRRAYLALRLRQGGYGGVLALLPERGTVVDLGAGDGLFAQLAARTRPGLRIVAVDADPDRVERLRAAAGGLPVIAVRARMEEFLLPPCDGVILLDVLHYLDPGAQVRLLRAAADALRPGGLILLRDPDRGAGARFALTRLHERVFLAAGFTRGAFGRYRTGEEWGRLLAAAGLRPEVRPLPRGTPYADRTVTGRKP